MNILKQAMSSASRVEAGGDLPARLQAVVDRLHLETQLDPQAKQDIVSILEDGIELASSMLDPTYPGELVLRRVTSILSASQRILTHTESHRPDRKAFSAMLPDGSLLPFVADTPEEAETQLNKLKRVGVSESAVVIPVRVSSSYVRQPRRIAQNPPPIPEPIAPQIQPVFPRPSGVTPGPGIAGAPGAQSGAAQFPTKGEIPAGVTAPAPTPSGGWPIPPTPKPEDSQ